MKLSQQISTRYWDFGTMAISGLSELQIRGSVKKLGLAMTFPCQVFLHDRQSMQVVKRTLSDEQGNYSFNGVVRGFKYAITALDPARQYNAVIQDNVVPK